MSDTVNTKYAKLSKVEEYDKEAAEELATALNEVTALEGRISQLRDLINENKKLHPFVWTTADGLATAVHNLEDDHLKNILQHVVNYGQSPNKGIKSEARKRGFVIPTEARRIEYDRRKMLAVREGEVIDHNRDW